MELYIQKQNKARKIRFSGTVGGLLKKLKANPEAVLVTVNSSLATEDDMITDTDKVAVLEVVSGG